MPFHSRSCSLKDQNNSLSISAFKIVPTLLPFFCKVLKVKFFFFNIPSYPPPFAIRNSLTNQFYNTNKFLDKKNLKIFRDPPLHFSFAFFLLKISRNFNLFDKIDFSMNSGRQQAGDS